VVFPTCLAPVSKTSRRVSSDGNRDVKCRYSCIFNILATDITRTQGPMSGSCIPTGEFDARAGSAPPTAGGEYLSRLEREGAPESGPPRRRLRDPGRAPRSRRGCSVERPKIPDFPMTQAFRHPPSRRKHDGNVEELGGVHLLVEARYRFRALSAGGRRDGELLHGARHLPDLRRVADPLEDPLREARTGRLVRGGATAAARKYRRPRQPSSCGRELPGAGARSTSQLGRIASTTLFVRTNRRGSLPSS